MSRHPPYTPPKFREMAFNCPSPECGAYAQHYWTYLSQCELHVPGPDGYEVRPGKFAEISRSTCQHCGLETFWCGEEAIHPQTSPAPAANLGLSGDIRDIYNEAASIVARSPRGAAALLRLALEHLCRQLVGKKMKDLDKYIGELVSQGLPEWVQQALDAVRVIGNNAVHPGQIDLKDDSETATALFVLINAVADHFITRPEEIEKQYAKLPQTVLKAIAERDGSPEPTET